MDICEAMMVRRSVRTYSNKQMPDEMLSRLAEFFNKTDRLNDLSVRLVLMPAREVEHAMTGLVGSYGSIKNAPIYAIGISEKGENDQVNFGFATEQFILECTREGLGTCWIGGFFKASLLDQAVPKNDNERIICVSPLGYGAKRRFAERTMRALGGLNTRKPLAERVFYNRWGQPATEFLTSRPKLLQTFELARWAPSASNKQPCHYVVDQSLIVLAILGSPQSNYPSFVMRGRPRHLNYPRIDAGIAMCHIHLAAKELGIKGKWTLDFVEPTLRKKYRIEDDAQIVGVFEFEGLRSQPQ